MHRLRRYLLRSIGLRYQWAAASRQWLCRILGRYGSQDVVGVPRPFDLVRRFDGRDVETAMMVDLFSDTGQLFSYLVN